MMKYTKGVMNFLFPGRSGLWCEVAFAMEAWKHCVTLTMKTTRQTDPDARPDAYARRAYTSNPTALQTDRQRTRDGRAGHRKHESHHTRVVGSSLEVPASKHDGSRRVCTPRSLRGAGVHGESSTWNRGSEHDERSRRTREHDECARAELSRRPSELALPPRRGIAKLQADR